MNHLLCLRHILVSLGTTEFASQVKDIVCTTCHKDYLKIIKVYEERWLEMSDEKKIEELNSLLMKIGHKFEQGNLIITDYDRWISVSMINRPHYPMPSCTNQIDSIIRCHLGMDT